MNGDQAGPDEPTGAYPADLPTASDGPATEAIPAQSYGWVLGNRYRVLDRLGAGGMAEVFRAHDELLDRDVAVKVFRSVPAVADTATRKERQHAELRALAQLNHPNLITLYDGVLTERPAYLVIELIDGLSLAHRIEQGPLPERDVRDIGRQVADALGYVHSRGMVHRDVKPANILLGTDATSDDSTTRVRLSDFGVVRLLGSESMTSVGSTLGTASYLAPEQTRGSAVGPAADIYALGLTLIEALTGQRSFDGPPLEAAMARLHRDPVIPVRAPGPWPNLLAAMTARDPQARPTAAQVSRALRSSPAGAAGTAGIAGATTGLLTTLPPDDAGTAYLPAAGFAAPPAHPGLPPVPPVRGPLPPVHPIEAPLEHRRGVGGYLIAAAIVLVALVVGGILLFSSSSGGSGGSSGATTPTTSTTHSTARETRSNQPIGSASVPSTAASTPSSESTPPPSTEPDSEPPSTPDTSTSNRSSASSSAASSASSSASSSATKTTSNAGPAGPARDASAARDTPALYPHGVR